MKRIDRWRRAVALGCMVCSAIMSVTHAGEPGWPELETEHKPWTRWWWLGSGVDEANLTRELEAFAAAGIGGVEICPIYGAVGYEDRNREFLSEEWMAALAHTMREAERLGLGVDMTTGTGWPFGGPWVTPEMASHGLVRVKESVAGGETFRHEIEGDPVAWRAVADDGARADLAPEIEDGRLAWTAPEGADWTVYGLSTRSPIQRVKRAAPGGEGPVLDPFSPDAMRRYLARFDEAFGGFRPAEPRAHFHDSFEYYGAEWTPGMRERFRERHGYDLADHLPAFFGEGDADTVARVRADWRETLSAAHRGYLETWNTWANQRGSLTRNQAHGSPGNLLDHYAVADIPETEIFREVEAAQVPMMRLAASAAHLRGRGLVSAESFTWLGEHFQVTPGALKEAADFLHLSGVNHLFFHGIPYSPEDARWPGWLFYASTHMGPNGGLWRELPAFNAYLGRVQSVLQSGRPDTEVLVYFPFEDLARTGTEELTLFTIHNQDEWLHGTPFHETAMSLWRSGIPYDAVSGRLLEKVRVEESVMHCGDVRAKVLLVPEVEQMPVRVMTRLRRLAESGARIVFLGGVPEDVPGLGNLETRRKAIRELANGPEEEAVVSADADLSETLAPYGIEPEPMTAAGVRCVRRAREDGHDYFVVNRGDETVDRFVTLRRSAASVLLMDPMHAERRGLGARDDEGAVRLRLAPGESVVIRTYDRELEAPSFSYWEESGEPRRLGGPWSIEFLRGGPEKPEAFEMEALRSWTEGDDPTRKVFSGTARYTATFEVGEVPETPMLLDLGRVEASCRARLNGHPLGSSFAPPHRFEVSGALETGENELVVEVTNLAANRIAALDRRGVEWKRFHEINFVNIDYEPFDASGWEPLASGLLGPVRLVPAD